MMRQNIKISILTIREAFLMILPYTIITATLLLLSQFLKLFEYDLSFISYIFSTLFPLVIFISISHHFSLRYNVDSFITFLISFSILITLNADRLIECNMTMIQNALSPLIFLIPISTVYLLKVLKPISTTTIYLQNSVQRLASYILLSIKIYTISIMIYMLLDKVVFVLFNMFTFSMSDEIFLLFRTFVIQVLWFFGIHGGNVFDMLAGKAFLSHSFIGEMSYGNFLNLFIVNGGSGATLSLIIAILLGSKDEHSRNIAKLSIPFSFFNISEIMIFGLPIILNKYLLIPFLFIPLLNIAFVFTLLSIYPITVMHNDFSWSTPIFINTYYATNGNLYALALQGMVLLMNTLIYLPFIKRYTNSQKTQAHIESLAKNLGIAHKFKKKEGLSYYEAQEEIIKSNIKLESIVKLLVHNRMLLYLQPIIYTETNTVMYYEGLLRLKMEDGTIQAPFFLEDIEKSGFVNIIDLWVCREIKKHIDTLENTSIQFNINMHSNTLDDTDAIEKIIQILKGKNIAFEIIERNLLQNTVGIKNVHRLKQEGFKIYIDDVGDGYSNYMMFCTLPIDGIKIDKSLTDIIDTKKGYLVVRHIVNLSNSLGYTCVIEGVETQIQLDISKELGINFVQGYYYSPAFEMKKAHTFKL